MAFKHLVHHLIEGSFLFTLSGHDKLVICRTVTVQTEDVSFDEKM